MQTSKLPVNSAPKLFFAVNDLFTDVMVFDIAPNRLVRIQLRRVRRQEEQPELAVETLNIVSNPTSMMNRVVIEDQENRLVNVLHQSLEETKKRIGVHVAMLRL